MKISTADRIKLIISIVETTKKISKFLPIVVFSYSGLTLFFAIMNFFEGDIIVGGVLSIFAILGLYLTVRIIRTRRRGRKYKKYRN